MCTIVSKQLCCGCGACIQICPKGCIEMRADEEGFYYPHINNEQCINCGMCSQVCPVKVAENKSEDVVQGYVAYSKNDTIREKSSSGGIFSLLAEIILQQNGRVFGAAFDKEFMVHHIGIQSTEELELLRGSKYLQSRIENTYIEVKSLLEESIPVLYSGTACQIAGLKRFLRKDYDTLYTVDVLCHGVPSPKVWKYYITEQEKKQQSSLKDINFRDKKTGWKKFSVKLQFQNSANYNMIHPKDSYMNLFLNEICLRPSCHNCQFKKLERPSDITIGDCWGIDRYMPEMDDDKGTSVIFTHSDKGEQLLNAMKGNLVISIGEKDKLLPPSADSRKSVIPHKNREKFFKWLNEGREMKNLLKLIEPSEFEKMKRLVVRVFFKCKRVFEKIQIFKK